MPYPRHSRPFAINGFRFWLTVAILVSLIDRRRRDHRAPADRHQGVSADGILAVVAMAKMPSRALHCASFIRASNVPPFPQGACTDVQLTERTRVSTLPPRSGTAPPSLVRLRGKKTAVPNGKTVRGGVSPGIIGNRTGHGRDRTWRTGRRGSYGKSSDCGNWAVSAG